MSDRHLIILHNVYIMSINLVNKVSMNSILNNFYSTRLIIYKWLEDYIEVILFFLCCHKCERAANIKKKLNCYH